MPEEEWTETEVLALARSTIELIRREFGDSRLRLVLEERTFPLALSIAAASHQCVVLHELAEGVERGQDPLVRGLILRHHFETWTVGMHLLLRGQDSLELLVGEGLRTLLAAQKDMTDQTAVATAHNKRVRKVKKENAKRTLAMEEKGIQIPLLDEQEEMEIPTALPWERLIKQFGDTTPQRWQVEVALREIEKEARVRGLPVGDISSAYTYVYRNLSLWMGAHPTHLMLENYLEPGRFFVAVRPTNERSAFTVGALITASVLTAGHARYLYAERGLDVSALDDLIQDVHSRSK